MESNTVRNAIKAFEKAQKDWASAVKRKDVEVANIMMDRALRAYEAYKEEMNYQDETINSSIGAMSNAVKESLPDLFLNDKKALRETLLLIKGDKNLKSQLQFFETMENYDGSSDAKGYINESLDLAEKSIDFTTLKESNKKLGEMLVAHDIKPQVSLDEGKDAFLEAGSYLLSHRKTLGNLSEYSKNRGIVENYISNHKKSIEEDKVDINGLTEDFDRKMSMLNEDERNLVDDIINSKSSVAEERQKKFFYSLKEKCLEKVNDLIKGTTEEDKTGLEAVKDEISSMEYHKESIVKDTAKLLEVGSVLSDNDNPLPID